MRESSPPDAVLASGIGVSPVALALAIVLGHSTVHRAAWSRTHRSDFTVYTAAGDAFLRVGEE